MIYQVFLGALLAEIAGTIAGFGSSSIFLPIAHQFFSYHTALILVAIYHIFGNITRLVTTWQSRNKKIFFLFGVPSIITTIIGAMLASRIDPAILKVVLGCVLCGFAGYSLMRSHSIVITSPRVGRIGGALSGFTAGLIGTGGVLRGACMTMFGLSKDAYIATIASVALLVDITRIPVYFQQGFLPMSYWRYIPGLLCIAYVGTRLGKKIVARMSTTILRKVILCMVMIMSILLVFQGLS